MKFDFNEIIERSGKDAIAIDGIGKSPTGPKKPKEGFDFIPMWVADMNFKTAPSITEAIQERLKHPLFGYFENSDEYYNAIINWHKIHHDSDIKKENIGYENGVLGGLISALESFTAPGDYVLLHSPCYIGFTNSIKNAGRNIIYSNLIQDENGVWRMDYQDMDQKIKQHKIHFVVFCSPHNPCGRVWTKEELTKAMEVYKQNNCIVVSDEIWSDIILDDHKHIPLQSINEDAKRRTIALYAVSKTFNLAGLIGSYHVIYDSYIKDRVRAQSSKSHYNSMNVLSMHALIGAYSNTGKEWKDELNQVISKNVDYAIQFINNKLKGVQCTRPEGTYMLFIDCKEYLEKSGIKLSEEGKVALLTFDRELTYEKLVIFNNLLVKGAFYISTHPDYVCPTKDIPIPDAGSFISMFKTSSGRMPDLIIGKPNKTMADMLTEKLKLNRQEITMIGDRLYTDIAFGVNNGFNSVLVLSGETTSEMYDKSDIIADLVIKDMNELVNII